MTEAPKPKTVEVGQMWKDGDKRSSGTGEFTVVEVITHWDASTGKEIPRKARVLRHATNRHSTIRVDRLLAKGKRGYIYLGKKR